MTPPPAVPRSRNRAGFTLLELMIVIGIMAIMLVVLIPAVNSLTKSGGRKAAIGSLLGAVEQARAEAIKSGRATYVVFPSFSTATPATVNRYHYKAFAIFEDNPADATKPNQITNWKTLNPGIAFRAASGVFGSIADLPDGSPATFTFSPQTNASVTFHCVKFNANGEVESPVVTGGIPLTVFEGYVNASQEVVTSVKDAGGNPTARQSIKIAQLTGRAEIVP